MKNCLEYIKKIIKEEINAVEYAEEQLNSDKEQLKKIEDNIKNDESYAKSAELERINVSKQMSVIQDPAQKKVFALKLPIEIGKEKDFKERLEQDKKDLEYIKNKIKNDEIKLNYAKKGIEQQSSEIEGIKTESIVDKILISPQKSNKGKVSLPLQTRTFFTEQNDSLPPLPNTAKEGVKKGIFG